MHRYRDGFASEPAGMDPPRLAALAGTAAAPLPQAVEAAVRRSGERAEVLVCLCQLAAIALFGVLYLASDRQAMARMSIEPVPFTLAAYLALTLLRLRLALRGALRPPLLAASILLDVAVLMATIWSFHLQYGQPAAFVLKAPTLFYLFIIIALRALRFEPVWVIVSGAAGILGWAALVGLALADPASPGVTRDYVAYMTSARILIGAEIDKIVAIAVVSALLALAIHRARGLLRRAVAEGAAAAALSRFFAPEVAGRIAGAGLAPGQAESRDAVAMFVDLRGFTPLAERLAPPALLALLTEWRALVSGIVVAHGGSIDKFLGDGVLASFGAVSADPRAPALAMAAAEDLAEAARRWCAGADTARPAGIGIGIAAGPMVVGAIGDATRLEFTVLGDPVNVAAKLEKHAKAEAAPVVATAAVAGAARAAGWRPRLTVEARPARAVEGLARPLDLVAVGA